MTTLKNFWILLIGVGLVFISSCSDDDDETPSLAGPELTIQASVDGANLSNGGDVNAGDTVDFDITVNAPAGFNTINISQDGSVLQTFSRDPGEFLEQATFDLQVTTNVDQAGTSATLDFEAIDDENQTNTSSFSFSLVSPDAKVQTAVLLEAPLADNSSLTFYSISEDQRYSQNDVFGTPDPISENIDIGYFFGQTDDASLSSPALYPADILDLSLWSVRNSTKLELTTLSPSDFMELSTVADVESALSGIDLSTAEEFITNLSEDDVIAFRTSSSIEGLMIVQRITPGDGQNGQIELEFILTQSN